ncbi:MAG: Eco57I restriction-modification methylase domain-containing protein [Bacteroidaceae bacterium]|nr:Eco57I restriction-modification methylase domain-containing protein [Bacteroidaceae bacterium]
MSTRLSLQDALKRVHLNTVTLKNEEIARFIRALQEHLKPRSQLTNYSEKVVETHVRDFLLAAFYQGEHYIGKKDENNTDLCLFAGTSEDSPVQVLIECKNPKPDNQEMISDTHLNRRGLHEVITYYIDELSKGNYEVKYLLVTNGYDWYVFEALMIRQLIAKNELVEKYRAIKAPAISRPRMATFYEQEVKPAVEAALGQLVYTGFSLEKADHSPGIKSICKMLSPYFLLKQSYDDKYALNERFYNELLYIIGLEEKKKNGRPIITRRSEEMRDSASLLENTLHQLSDFPRFTSLDEESQIDLALELVLMWVNRMLFIKLVESQLVSFNRDGSKHRFFTNANIKDYNDLNELFFQVLAVSEAERHTINPAFEEVPYLNSRLFELSSIEADFFRISSLKVERMSYFERTVLAEDAKRNPQGISNIKYIIDFLNNYDFGADSKEMLSFAREEKELINASVLGKIFEKINGYKDGAVFTPSTITQFICQQTLERTVVEKFREQGWTCSSLSELKELICRENRHRASQIVNSIRVCDPAVGSGHFLVSALNQLVEIKYRLGILLDDEGFPVRGYTIKIIDDELVIRDEEGNRFAYKRNTGTLKLQKVLFREKRDIIENCLFGVDINPNSVNICQLRLWIELLKNAYYDDGNHLVTLPNIDINIKCGDSMIHQKSLADDLRGEMARARMTVQEYKQLVAAYKNIHDKVHRKEIQARLEDLKENILYIIRSDDELYKKRNKAQSEWYELTDSLYCGSIGHEDDGVNEKLQAKIARLIRKVEKFNKEIREREEMYRRALEWRFVFPEVLDEDGRFVGFDCIVGNPPYISVSKLKDVTKAALKKSGYTSFDSTGDICMLFYEYGMDLLKPQGILMYITTNTWLRSDSGAGIREYMGTHSDPMLLIDFKDAQLFDNVTVATNILLARKSENRHKTLACEIDTYNKKMNLGAYISDKLVENSFGAGNPWVVLSEADKDVISTVEEHSCMFSDFGFEINSGIKTACNNAYVLDTDEKRQAFIDEDAHSDDIIKKIVVGEHLSAFSCSAHAWLLNVHNGLKEEQLPPVNIADYPAVKRHLDKYKDDVVSRQDQGDTPYNLRNCAYLHDFEKPKVMWGELSDKPKFFYDSKGEYYCLNTVYFFTGQHLEYLVCYLNSHLCEYLFSKRGTTSGTGTLRWLKYTVNRLLVPTINPADEKVIAGWYSEFMETGNSSILERINAKIYELAGLDQRQIDYIESLRVNAGTDEGAAV